MYRNKIYEQASEQNKKIEIIMSALFEKSERESEHSERVSTICKEIGARLILNQEELSQIELTGLVHDIGKIGVDESILNKEGKLNDAEMREIRKHPEKGWRILRGIHEFSDLAEGVLAHHERWDGRGYPRGIKGKTIPLSARIISIADAFDAMTSKRSYRIIPLKTRSYRRVKKMFRNAV